MTPPPHLVRQLARQYSRAHAGEKPDILVLNPTDLREEGLIDRIFLMASPAMPKGRYWIGLQSGMAAAAEEHHPLP